ncbi:hypothetical protein IG631_12068 [Alternaria alternata]|nr:hypothetical protein IG631_12068 [Alternaria alternata]
MTDPSCVLEQTSLHNKARRLQTPVIWYSLPFCIRLHLFAMFSFDSTSSIASSSSSVSSLHSSLKNSLTYKGPPKVRTIYPNSISPGSTSSQTSNRAFLEAWKIFCASLYPVFEN